MQDADKYSTDLEVPEWIKKVEDYNAKANFVSISILLFATLIDFVLF